MSLNFYRFLWSRSSNKKRRPKSVLIIDDDFAIRVILHNVLHKDCTPITLNNGLEATAWLANNDRPDLIISDINMPMIDGITFIKMMSQSGLYRNIPIIILSGHRKADVKSHISLHPNIIAWIDKPFNPIYVKEKVLSLLSEEAVEAI